MKFSGSNVLVGVKVICCFHKSTHLPKFVSKSVTETLMREFFLKASRRSSEDTSLSFEVGEGARITLSKLNLLILKLLLKFESICANTSRGASPAIDLIG